MVKHSYWLQGSWTFGNGNCRSNLSHCQAHGNSSLTWAFPLIVPSSSQCFWRRLGFTHDSYLELIRALLYTLCKAKFIIDFTLSPLDFLQDCDKVDKVDLVWGLHLLVNVHRLLEYTEKIEYFIQVSGGRYVWLYEARPIRQNVCYKLPGLRFNWQAKLGNEGWASWIRKFQYKWAAWSPYLAQGLRWGDRHSFQLDDVL